MTTTQTRKTEREIREGYEAALDATPEAEAAAVAAYVELLKGRLRALARRVTAGRFELRQAYERLADAGSYTLVRLDGELAAERNGIVHCYDGCDDFRDIVGIYFGAGLELALAMRSGAGGPDPE